MTDSDVRDLVDRALLPLKAVNEELHAHAVDYVVGGETPQVLREAASFDNDLSYCFLPATQDYYGFPSLRRQRLEAVGIKWESGDYEQTPLFGPRDALYRSDAVSLAQWTRLGHLLDVILQSGVERNPGTSNRAPRWLDALLIDLLGTVDGSLAKTNHIYAEQLRENRPAWDARRLVALLEQAGVESADVPATVFLAVYADTVRRPSSIHRRSAVDLPGVADYLVEHAGALSGSLMDVLRPEERRDVLARMTASPRWAEAGAHLVAALSVGASKELRWEAVDVLSELGPEVRCRALAPVLAQAPASRCQELAEFLVRAAGGADLLVQAAEANRRLADLVSSIRARYETLSATGVDEPLDLPPFTPLEIGPSAAPIRAELRKTLEQLIATADEQQCEWWCGLEISQVSEITEEDLDDLVAVADGHSHDYPDLLGVLDIDWIIEHAPSLTLSHVLRLHAVKDLPSGWSKEKWCKASLNHYTGPETDPRALEDLVVRLGCRPDFVTSLRDIRIHGRAFAEADVELVWPWYAEHPKLLRERLMEASTLPHALEIVAASPTAFAELLPVVADMALGPSRVSRPLAQAALRSHPGVRGLAELGLAARAAEVRASAAAWVGSLGQGASVPALRAALGRERKEVVRAALLAALERCGGDIAEFLSPEVLETEAAKGLKGKTPASLSWLDLEALPAVRWGSGDAVDPRIIRWWVVLADRMRNPSGRGLIDLYLSLLEPGDAAALAAHVTRAWVAHDTRHPQPEESRAHARGAGRQRYDEAQRWLAYMREGFGVTSEEISRAKAGAAIPLEKRIAEAYTKHQRTYVGSSMPDKGLLAFAVRMDGGELAGLVRSYMRDNPNRRAQLEALVRVLHANSSPEALQVLLDVARRHRMLSVQRAAAALAQEAADERGWSADELADRTIPTAGFDDDGLLRLSYGDRELTGRLAPDFKIVLSDATGKVRKSLPAPRVDEDPEVVKETRKRLTAARKEARAVLTLQAERLHEAMCGARTWRGADWRALLVAYPLVGRLVTRLIWTAGPAGGGEAVTFRPTEDGALLGADDADVPLADDAVVGLAHGTLLSAAQAEAWRAHLADYEVEPLFDQLSATAPRIGEGQKVLTDLQGHVTDTFTFRGAATRRGYQRGKMLDGGNFEDYVKELPSANLTVVLGFTGSYVPEENMPCATTGLSFTRRGRTVGLADIPPILLAECYADYEAMAALGPFDPDWEENATPLW